MARRVLGVELQILLEGEHALSDLELRAHRVGDPPELASEIDRRRRFSLARRVLRRSVVRRSDAVGLRLRRLGHWTGV